MLPLASHDPSRDVLVAWLRFTLAPGVFDRWQRRLLVAFGSPREALGASVQSLSRFVPTEVAEGLARGPAQPVLDRALAWLAEPGHHLVTLEDAHYPLALLHIADPPTALYVQGRPELLNAPSFAIVGSRNATVQGLHDARAFARTLSDAGLTIVSGLALGIDAAAHRGGLDGEASSIAVLGTGADGDYPRRNAALRSELAQRGALVSEFPLGSPPAKEHFPKRNRLISGLARGVLVVEAAVASGSLITAHEANDQGRDVFALPGSIHASLSKGCHKLIQEGAKLVDCANDILEELRLPVAAPTRRGAQGVEHQDHAFLDAMGFAPQSIDQIASATGKDCATVAAHLSQLEISGSVAGLAGGLFQRLDTSVIE
ncbi:DNA protecting protein DprA [Betaproteobacteria bacterium GR16-43]|nr:DNA protecting protein DprA [Betaproteobacteria bacterium GR16-43]